MPRSAMMTEGSLKELLSRAARLANLRNNGPHILRQTPCSHLAMRGPAARAIQEFAGRNQRIALNQGLRARAPRRQFGGGLRPYDFESG